MVKRKVQALLTVKRVRYSGNGYVRCLEVHLGIVSLRLLSSGDTGSARYSKLIWLVV